MGSQQYFMPQFGAGGAQNQPYQASATQTGPVKILSILMSKIIIEKTLAIGRQIILILDLNFLF
jgi:hypothetical protein